ncbi:hypothetical protein PZ897_05975 [Hoeflea sp. YIM 152468]|uniref:hypothetical protein n=1 Tax=Hoeflea sp. YIM 152468 TaxID=3031759 RepID=UPI0023DB23BF|nr:hypothetical protein [Hoeflea sp. YIM 152468]MDF1607719.1 hypothetical protein [Hoeflea sp. YIM 152468]
MVTVYRFAVLLSGQLDPGLVPDELLARAELLNQRHPVRLILGVHRNSTLDL